MNINADLLKLFDGTLNLEGRSMSFTASTPLIGALPELDSMGVVSLITALEDHFGLTIDDEEIDGAVFETWGAFQSFVEGKLGA